MRTTLTLTMALALAAGALPCRGGELPPVGQLVTDMRSPDIAKRRAAISGLREHVRRSALAISALGRATADPDGGTAVHALTACIDLGEAASGAADHVAKALKDPRASVKLHAGLALTKIAPKRIPEAADGLATLLDHPETGERKAALNALIGVAPYASSALPKIEKLMVVETDAAVRRKAEMAAKRIKAGAKARMTEIRAEIAALAEREKALRVELERLSESDF